MSRPPRKGASRRPTTARNRVLVGSRTMRWSFTLPDKLAGRETGPAVHGVGHHHRRHALTSHHQRRVPAVATRRHVPPLHASGRQTARRAAVLHRGRHPLGPSVSPRPLHHPPPMVRARLRTVGGPGELQAIGASAPVAARVSRSWRRWHSDPMGRGSSTGGTTDRTSFDQAADGLWRTVCHIFPRGGT
jgi:hypothetical protein